MVKCRAQTVNISRISFGSCGYPFRAYVVRADPCGYGFLRADGFRFHNLCEPEIPDFDIIVGIQHDIRGLHVVMYDAMFAGVFQPFGNIVNPFDGIIHRDGQIFAGFLLLFQRTAVHELHDNIGLAVAYPAGIDGNDSVMVDRGGGSCLVQEKVGKLAGGKHFLFQNLDCDFTVERDVQRPVNGRHPAGPDGFLKQIIVEPGRDDQLRPAHGAGETGKRFQACDVQLLLAVMAENLDGPASGIRGQRSPQRHGLIPGIVHLYVCSVCHFTPSC